MSTNASDAEAKNFEMLMKIVSDLRDDNKESEKRQIDSERKLTEIIKELRQEVRDSNKNCSNRTIECGKNFIPTTTFWKMYGIVIALSFGAYGFTGAVLKYMMTHAMIL